MRVGKCHHCREVKQLVFDCPDCKQWFCDQCRMRMALFTHSCEPSKDRRVVQREPASQ